MNFPAYLEWVVQRSIVRRRGVLGATFGLLFIGHCFAQTEQTDPSPSPLKGMSLEELLNVEVTSVSKSPQKLLETASAIQVITGEDIRRSGASRLPEALRLAPNLDVAQIDPRQWAISARGFNGGLADKLLVMIDGRAIYSPLFAGVFWDIQEVFLEDVDQIEVISGPGGTLWGANAVNGVINVTTKSARDTQGLFVEGGGGTAARALGGIRYGGTIAPNLYFRVYGKYLDRDSTEFPDGTDGANDWRIGQGGFRMDWEPSQTDQFTLQGDLYDSRAELVGTNDAKTVGNNVIGRWSHAISESSDFKLQLYYDRVHRNVPDSYNDALETYDIDFQHRFPLGSWNEVIWGLGYRLADDNFKSGTPGLVFLPESRSLQTITAFAQDEITLVKNRLTLTLGTKVEHNDYSHFEFQPSGRLAWKIDEQQIAWGAISRAVRTPARLDRDLVIPPVTFGSPNFESEELLAYELGYRIKPHERLSVSLAVYYNDYDDIRSTEQVNPPNPIPLVFGNDQEGESYGGELTVDYRPTDWWLLRAGFNELELNISPKAGSTDTTHGIAEAADSHQQVFLRSFVDLPGNIQLDMAFRFVSRVDNPTQDVPAYEELDVRLGWQPIKNLEISVVGQNLLHDHHFEFGDPVNRQQIERGVYGKVTWKF